jgi:hypothetical protein
MWSLGCFAKERQAGMREVTTAAREHHSNVTSGIMVLQGVSVLVPHIPAKAEQQLKVPTLKS